MNQWPGLRLRVTEGFDEDGFHEPESLHYEGRAVDITTSDRDRSKYGMLARLAVHAGFDFVYFGSRSHIHCSVKSEDQADVGRSGGCFTKESKLETPNGKRTMEQLEIGDDVLVAREDGSLHYSKIILFLDRNDNEQRVYQTIVTENGVQITMTPSHLIYVTKDKKKTVKIEEKFAKFAKDVVIGEYIFVKNNNSQKKQTNTVVLDKVVKITFAKFEGAYAPLTSEGNIIVNGVIVSCYAVIYDQSLAHLAFLPLRIAINFKHAIIHFMTKLNFIKRTIKPTNIYEHQTGVHFYPRFLYKATHLLLSKEFFYQ